MSYPYPQDRHRDRKEKGEQPYKDAKESMNQTESSLHAEAIAFGQAHQADAEDHDSMLKLQAEERLAAINKEIEREHRTHEEQ